MAAGPSTGVEVGSGVVMLLLPVLMNAEKMGVVCWDWKDIMMSLIPFSMSAPSRCGGSTGPDSAICARNTVHTAVKAHGATSDGIGSRSGIHSLPTMTKRYLGVSLQPPHPKGCRWAQQDSYILHGRAPGRWGRVSTRVYVYKCAHVPGVHRFVSTSMESV